MSPEELQAAKNAFAQQQLPDQEACTNPGCKFPGCTCGSKCACHVATTKEDSCDPCREFKAKKQAEAAAKAMS